MAPYHRQQVVKAKSPHPGEEGSVWIRNNRSSLPNNYWVAASSKGLVALQPTIGELMDEIYQKHIDPEVVAITFVTSDAV